MHTLQEVRAEYDRLDRLIGIDTRMIELKISRRAVRQLGSFRSPTRGRGPLRITLSALILDDDEQFWDTVRHEYAHAAVYLLYPGQKHGHDQVWRDMCRRVGCDPKRLAPEQGRAAELRQQKVKYIIRCRSCGAESRYIRRGRTVDLMLRGRGKRLRCRRCGGNDFDLLVRE
ncbi:MAG: SprT-like domain-containing protein [Oscillospiraceae bacterium]|nr:SprT-like domain-containing protein [Oscillospiraceae bacterium]